MSGDTDLLMVPMILGGSLLIIVVVGLLAEKLHLFELFGFLSIPVVLAMVLTGLVVWVDICFRTFYPDQEPAIGVTGGIVYVLTNKYFVSLAILCGLAALFTWIRDLRSR